MEYRNFKSKRQHAIREINKIYILKAAEEIFAQKGYGLTTMEEIAEKSQLSKPTIYHYFESKCDIFFEIILNSFNEVEQKLIEIKKKPKSAVEKVKEIIKFIFSFYSQKKNISRIFLTEKSLVKRVYNLIPRGEPFVSERDIKFLDDIKNRAKRIYRIMAEILQEGIDSGEFREMNVMDACYILDALLHGFFFKRFWLDKKYSYAKSADLIQTFFLLGIIREAKE